MAEPSKLTRAIASLRAKRQESSFDAMSAEAAIVEAQVNDVFLVLALLGESLLPLDIFDNAFFYSTLSETQASIASTGHAPLTAGFDNLGPELEYACTAALVICAVFAPMHIYRGFGASVYGDWDWGCPDFEHLQKKTKKEKSFLQKMPDPQPNRAVLLAFDRAIQVLQCKPMHFLKVRPMISGFSESQPRYLARGKKETDPDIYERFIKCLQRAHHPPLDGVPVTTFGMPFASYTSPFNCEVSLDWSRTLYYQMDAGRLLHAFVCRDVLSLQEGQVLHLTPGSAAEVLACWLTGLPGTTHRIIAWDAFDTTRFDDKASKSLRKRISQFPLPKKFVAADPTAASRPRLASQNSMLSNVGRKDSLQDSKLAGASSMSAGPSPQDTALPPPYSALSSSDSTSTPESTNHSQTEPVELGERDPAELACNEVTVVATSSDPSKPLPAPQSSKTTALPARKPVARGLSQPVSGQSSQNLASQTPNSTNEDAGRITSQCAPQIPPKVPIDDSEGAIRPALRQTMSTPASGPSDMSSHYLRLLNAVARGDISREDLQIMLKESPGVDGITPPGTRTEPQELESIPAPPRFAGVTIPIGRSTTQGSNGQPQASGSPIPASLKPGPSRS